MPRKPITRNLILPLLSKHSDSEIAHMLVCSKSYVNSVRNEYGSYEDCDTFNMITPPKQDAETDVCSSEQRLVSAVLELGLSRAEQLLSQVRSSAHKIASNL